MYPSCLNLPRKPSIAGCRSADDRGIGHNGEVTETELPESEQSVPVSEDVTVSAPAAAADADAVDTAPFDTDVFEVVAVEVESAETPNVEAVEALPPVLDEALAGAVELARAAAVEAGGQSVGVHVGVTAELDLVATHAFAATLVGYSGWYWAATVARAPESDAITVDEVVLLPGVEALLAPAWVPWHDRLQPGDLSPGDLLPADPDDPRLVPAYAFNDDSDESQVKEVGLELGLGRIRVMSHDGRLDAAERWFAGDRGPRAPMAKQAPAPCGTCGFLLALAGSLGTSFGVCGNGITDTDGVLVSVEYGCGAHSEVKVVVPSLAEPIGAVYDDGDTFETTLSEPTASEPTASEPTVLETALSEEATFETVAGEAAVSEEATFETVTGEAAVSEEATFETVTGEAAVSETTIG
jgi:hypothetical protein